MSWSDLPADLVAAIADRISAHADLARFRSVCPSWRSASAAHATRRRAPLLLLPSQDHFSVDRRFWSLAEDSIAKIPVPAARRRPFLSASPRGWTLAVDHYFSATLVHPFTGASAALPELPPAFRDIGNSVVLGGMVWDRSRHAVVIARRKGAPCAFFFCRPWAGDGGSRTRWSPVECPQLAEVSSVTYCDDGRESFYLFDGEERKTAVLDGATFAVAAVIEPPVMLMPMPNHLRRGAAAWEWRKPESTSTLVVSSGELLVIVWTPLHHPGGSDGSGELFNFKAFRMDRRQRPPAPERWAEIPDIGDRAVFVDRFRGFCVEANGLNGVRRNCVYVASSCEDASRDGRYTVDVLHLADLTAERLSLETLGKYRCASRFWQWPSWSMPNLH